MNQHSISSVLAVPFQELEGQSMTMKINYAYHCGVPKDEIMSLLGITNKKYFDIVWLYKNKGYKEKVVAFIASQERKAEKIKNGVVDIHPAPFDQLEDCSLRFKINYAYHFKVPKEEVLEKLGITNKTYIDKTWLYDNENYKQRILDFLGQKKAA